MRVRQAAFDGGESGQGLNLYPVTSIENNEPTKAPGFLCAPGWLLELLVPAG